MHSVGGLPYRLVGASLAEHWTQAWEESQRHRQFHPPCHSPFQPCSRQPVGAGGPGAGHSLAVTPHGQGHCCPRKTRGCRRRRRPQTGRQAAEAAGPAYAAAAVGAWGEVAKQQGWGLAGARPAGPDCCHQSGQRWRGEGHSHLDGAVTCGHWVPQPLRLRLHAYPVCLPAAAAAGALPQCPRATLRMGVVAAGSWQGPGLGGVVPAASATPPLRLSWGRRLNAQLLKLRAGAAASAHSHHHPPRPTHPVAETRVRW
mmetsp:Transcript_18051/g.50507  ORF Transcript_18051/g.50507 Transcript_18051/m.50507 type:complete len:257 (+) Transcript_18051:1012-1782(+)